MNPTPKPTEEQSAHPHRLEHLPITLFSIVMGMTGLAVAWQRTHWLDDYTSAFSMVIALAATIIFGFLVIIYGLKLFKHPSAVISELRHPIRLNFFPTISISLLLLSVYWANLGLLTLMLWSIGAALHLGFTLYVISSWIHHTHYTINHINPGWFIPVVGNIIIPITGTALGFTEISWFFFSIGLVFWLILFTVVIHRLILQEPLPPKLTPMLFILLAPPSIGFISYTLLTGEVDAFARVLYYTALFLGLLLGSNLVRYWKLPFFISSWAYSFPLAALTLSSFKFAEMTNNIAIYWLANAILILLSLLIAWLLIKTSKAIKQHKICVPE